MHVYVTYCVLKLFKCTFALVCSIFFFIILWINREISLSAIAAQVVSADNKMFTLFVFLQKLYQILKFVIQTPNLNIILLFDFYHRIPKKKRKHSIKYFKSYDCLEFWNPKVKSIFSRWKTVWNVSNFRNQTQKRFDEL